MLDAICGKAEAYTLALISLWCHCVNTMQMWDSNFVEFTTVCVVMNEHAP